MIGDKLSHIFFPFISIFAILTDQFSHTHALIDLKIYKNRHEFIYACIEFFNPNEFDEILIIFVLIFKTKTG